jgi:Dullard-like phosphatase family protein
MNSKNKKFQKKLTLILDLDETLVRFKINKYNIQTGNVVLRPGLIQFLNKVYPLFDLVIWTVATKQYADAILDIIERDKKYFSARLYREHATIDEKNNLYIKDLNNLGRPLDSIIIIDDKESSYRLHKDNGILIKPFMGSKLELQKDFVLFDLFTILTKIMLDKSKDVRIGISNFKYEIQQKISNANYS